MENSIRRLRRYETLEVLGPEHEFSLVDEHLNAGSQTLSWDGKDDKGNDLSSGIYFYQLKAGQMTETRRLVLLK